MKRIKHIFNFLVILLLVLLESSLVANEIVNMSEFKIQFQSKYYSESEANLVTDKLTVSISKEKDLEPLFKEEFDNYIVTDGWINLVIGKNSANPLPKTLFSNNKNWIKITLFWEDGTTNSMYYPMYAITKTLYSKFADQTITGNLFPSIQDYPNHLVMINSDESQVEYKSSENILQLIGLENPEKINQFFDLNVTENTAIIIASNNHYIPISTKNMLTHLGLSKFFGNFIPTFESFPNNKFLISSKTKDYLTFTDEIGQYTDIEAKATYNMFVGMGSSENSIFIYNKDKQAFEVSPTINLGFLELDAVILERINQKKSEFEAEDQQILSEYLPPDSVISKNINDIKLARELNDIALSQAFEVTDSAILEEIIQNDSERSLADNALRVSLNSIEAQIKSNDSESYNLDNVDSISSKQEAYKRGDNFSKYLIYQLEQERANHNAQLRVSIDAIAEALYEADTALSENLKINKAESDLAESNLRVSINMILNSIVSADNRLSGNIQINLAESLKPQLIVSVNALESAYIVADTLMRQDIQKNKDDSLEPELVASINMINQHYLQNDVDLNAQIDNFKLQWDTSVSELSVSLNTFESDFQAADTVLRSEYIDPLISTNSDKSVLITQLESDYKAADAILTADIQANKVDNLSAQGMLLTSANQLFITHLISQNSMIESVSQNKKTHHDINQLLRISIDAIALDYQAVDEQLDVLISQNKDFSDSAELKLRASINALELAYQAMDLNLRDIISENKAIVEGYQDKLITSLNLLLEAYTAEDDIVKQKIALVTQSRYVSKNNIIISINALYTESKISNESISLNLQDYRYDNSRSKEQLSSSLNALNDAIIYEDQRLEALLSTNRAENTTKFSSLNGRIPVLKDAATLSFENLDLLEDANKSQRDSVKSELRNTINAIASDYSQADSQFMAMIETNEDESIKDLLVISINAIESDYKDVDTQIRKSISQIDTDRIDSQIIATMNIIRQAYEAMDISLNARLIFNDNARIKSELISSLNAIYDLYSAQDSQIELLIDNIDVTATLNAIQTFYEDNDYDLFTSINTYILKNNLSRSALEASRNLLISDYQAADQTIKKSLDALNINKLGNNLYLSVDNTPVDLSVFIDDTNLSKDQVVSYIEQTNLDFNDLMNIKIDQLKPIDSNLIITNQSGSGFLVHNNGHIAFNDSLDASTKFKLNGEIKGHIFYGDASLLTDIVVTLNNITSAHIQTNAITKEKIESISWSKLINKPEAFFTQDYDTTYTPFSIAESELGSNGLVPAPLAGQQELFLKGDSSWDSLVHDHPFALDTHGHDYLINKTNDWVTSTPDNKQRFKYNSNSTTYFKSGHDGTVLFEFLNDSDQLIMKVDNSGRLWTSKYQWLDDYFIGTHAYSFVGMNSGHTPLHEDKANVNHGHTMESPDTSKFLDGTNNWSQPYGNHAHPFSADDHVHDYLSNSSNSWSKSTDNLDRFYFTTNGKTIFKAKQNDYDNLFWWQNVSKVSKLALINFGRLWSESYGWLENYFSQKVHNHSIYSNTSHTHPNPSSSSFGADYALNANGGWTQQIIASGIIIMWSGSTIPDGWKLCDGTNGTPNLADRFIVAYSDSGDYSSINNTGGSNNLSLSTSNLPSHSHTVSVGNESSAHAHGDSYTSTNHGMTSPSHSHSINNGNSNHSHSVTTYQDDWNEECNCSRKPGWANDSTYGYTNHHATSPGGSHSHSVQNNNASHPHSFSLGNNSANHTHSVTVNNAGSSTAIDNKPRYYKLAFIQKI
jgi:hypothetical protein